MKALVLNALGYGIEAFLETRAILES